MEQRLLAATERVDKIMGVLFSHGFTFEQASYIGGLGLPANIDWAFGATRLVVWDWDNPDFVVKIPLDEKCEKYCKREVKVYKDSVISGLNEYFAWTDFIREYDGNPVYAMEFVDCDYESVEEASYDSAYHIWCDDNGYDPSDVDTADEFNNVYYSCGMDEDSVLEWIFVQVDKNLRSALDRFINRHRINDIHSGNVGMINNHVCFCDYAGYNW